MAFDTIVKQFVPIPPSNPTDPTEFLPPNSDPGQIQVGANVPPHLTIHSHRSNYSDLPLDLTGMMDGGPSKLNLPGIMDGGPSRLNYLEPIVTGPSLNMGSFDILHLSKSIESFGGTSESATAGPASTSRSTSQTRTLRVGKAITAW